ncbi:hypothetical protein K491DRAFT_424059 [Lophiostoma macrostomum CBS 122681]|uniref:Uncharacterized protein n=1 Tax=Lophiostoma macrostomum CBS 122681 TaxID=1314788 RepID=A0A6A6T9D6_9PLEO|nr:hypothetical protein K491DRAFT_424059 [Lophiostoma macrostomum CBS 122681]
MMLADYELDDVRHIEIPLHILPITIVHITCPSCAPLMSLHKIFFLCLLSILSHGLAFGRAASFWGDIFTSLFGFPFLSVFSYSSLTGDALSVHPYFANSDRCDSLRFLFAPCRTHFFLLSIASHFCFG